MADSPGTVIQELAAAAIMSWSGDTESVVLRIDGTFGSTHYLVRLCDFPRLRELFDPECVRDLLPKAN